MFPYIHTEFLQLGPIKIYAWGFFVALGFLVGLVYLIKSYPQEKNIYIDIVLYTLVGAIIGARLFYVFFYSSISVSLIDFFKIWEGGLSSFGGFFGGAIAVWIYVKKKHLNFYKIAQKIAFILPLSLAIGRLGCFFINDHPGIKTNLKFLAVNYPDGQRFDLGLMLIFLNLIIFIFFLFKKKKERFLEYFMLIYGLGRFGLDFLRIGEPQIAGLIPSQYATIILIALSLYLFKIKKEKET